jgi:hypothetical protein
MTTDALRCPFKIELVGVVFQCQQRYGHWGRCYNDPEGCGNDARIAFRPTDAEKVEAMSQMFRETQGERKP